MLNNITDRTPYTYLIGWTAHNKWYYGVRYRKGCSPNDLWVTYFTSSKYVAKFRRLNGEPDIIIIKNTFNSIKDARQHEHKVLKRLDVIHKPHWLNEHNGTSPSPESALIGAKKSKPMKVEDSRRKLSSERMKGNVLVYKNLEKMNTTEVRERAKLTRNQNKLAGKYIESYKQQSLSVSSTLRHKIDHENFINDGWLTTEQGKIMAAKNNAPSECPHCGKIGQYRAMKRWHFDNCKYRILSGWGSEFESESAQFTAESFTN